MDAAGSGRWPANPLSRRRPVPVAEAPNRLDRGTPRGVRSELSTQVADVQLHLVARGAEAVAPDELAQLVVAQHLVRVPDEGGEQPVLQRSERHLALVVPDGALSEGDA